MIRFYKVYDFAKHGIEPQAIGALRIIELDGQKICMARTELGYFAVDNKCPHAGAHLGMGWCEDDHVVCPIHRYKYNLKNGRGKQGDYVNTYKVETRTDGVYIGIPKKWWQFW